MAQSAARKAIAHEEEIPSNTAHVVAIYTPAQLAKRWNCQPVRILALIHNKQLRAFSTSDPGSKKQHWRITADAAAEFEAGKAPTPKVKPVRRRRQAETEVIKFY